MGASGAVNILYRKELKGAEDRRARTGELVEQYRAQFASPYMSASRGYITDVIDPAETRPVLALALRKCITKRELRPAKKHGTIPL
jgi:acetyl-CoA carboxylase carboxyltransferase component